ncbi:cytochrome c oxidase assembly protein subunit 15 [Marininema mesophilum]|uniref:Heme A synthase n=1 Tax=Marininema mesophilum TaxID=1048340 RepID=A0A1H2UJ20_9BACL|nr:heme A synthase [Marininema mesophilum]SDW56101.1 cytochrome c oxidase assembly protein subunit 15 [Marininema mesophilum]
MKRLLRILAVFASVGNFIILIQGAVVTKTGSGEGCGNTWPFCYGEVFPTYQTLELWIEYSHRIVSGMVGMLVVALTILAWLTYRREGSVKLFASASLFFILLQGLMGAAAVVWSQSQAVLALHFGLSLLSFASSTLLCIVLYQLKRSGETVAKEQADVSQGLKLGIWGLAVYTYFVVYTGAFVRHMGASLACSEWPLCGGAWLPDMTTPQGIQLMHRFFAGLLFFMVLWLLIAIYKRYPKRGDLKRGAWIAFLLVLAQVFTGGLIVLTQLELLIALLHTTLIAAFFASLCYLAMQVGSPWQKNRLPNSSSEK